MANRIKVTDRARRNFLEGLRRLGNVSAAARGTGVTRKQWYVVRARGIPTDDRPNPDPKDVAFLEEWNAAMDEAIDALEEEARRRAEDGVADYVTYKGELVMVPKDPTKPEDPETNPLVPLIRRQYSDRMMELLLKGHRSELFKERRTHEIGGPIDEETGERRKIQIEFV